jgi:hypothetical protein
MFSVVSAPRLYNKNLTQLELELGRILETAVECIWEEMARKELECDQEDFMCELTWEWDCDKSVARIRLVKTENTSAWVTVNWKCAE